MADLEIKVTGRDAGAGSVMQQVRRQLEQLSNSLRQLEGTTDGSNQALAESIGRYQRASREAISLKAEFISLKRSGEGTEEMFRALSERIELAQNKEREAIEETRRLGLSFQTTNQEAEQFSDDLRFLNEQLDKSQGFIDGVSVAAKRQEAALQGVTTEVKQTTTELKQLNQSNERVADGMDETARETKRAGDALDTMNRKGQETVAFGNIMAEVFEEALYAVKQFAGESIQEFWDFDRGMREISTLIPGHTDLMRTEMGEDIQALSIDLGRMSEEILPAVYLALSSGRGTETVLEDVALASEAARASVGELEGTMASGLAVLNAYGEEAYSLQEIYDQFFFGIKEGVFTMDDLAGGMSALTSISAETKTPLEDIMATLIVMTKQGDSFNEAVELSGLLLTQLGTEGSAAANAFMDSTGQSYREFIAQGGTLGEALQAIQNHADETGQSIGSMIAGNSPFFRDQQAARAALELTGIHMQELVDTSNQARDAQGSMAEASEIMGEAAETGSLKAKAAFDVLKAQAGEALLGMNLLGFGVIDTGISIENAITGAATIMQATTGAMSTSIENIIEDNLAHAKSVEELVAEYQKLDSADSMYLGLGDVITRTADEINDGKDQIVEALAATATSFDEYLDALVRMGLAEADAVGAEREYYRELYNTAQAATVAAEATAQEVDEKQASITIMRNAAAARQRETAAMVAQRIALNDSIHGYEAEAEGVVNSLANQSVATQEAMHGLDIYRESLVYAGDANVVLADTIDPVAEKMLAEAESMASYWSQAEGLVDTWVAAQGEGAAAIIAANQAISASYEETFVTALLNTEGLTRADMDAMVAAGLLSQAEADLQWQVASTNQEIMALTQTQGFNKLTADQQAEAFRLLKEGLVLTAESAIRLAQDGYAGALTPELANAKLEAVAVEEQLLGLDEQMVISGEAANTLANGGYSPLVQTLSNAKLEADLLGGELDYLGTVEATPIVNTPDLGGAISQAQQLKDLLNDLANMGSAGGYGGNLNPDGGVGGGANVPGNATGTNYFEGGLSWVGEDGPELVSLPRGSRIYNNRDSQQMMSKTINIAGDTFIMNNRGQDEAQAAATIVMNRRRERANAAARIN